MEEVPLLGLPKDGFKQNNHLFVAILLVLVIVLLYSLKNASSPVSVPLVASTNPTEENSRVISYVPADIDDPAELVAEVRARRGGTLLNLDRMLLHSAPVARGWNQLFGEIRGSNLSIDPKLRELIMCGVAVLNHAEYEFFQHEPFFRQAGATDEQVIALRKLGQPDFPSSLFTSLERMVATLTLELTRNVLAPDELMYSLKEELGEQGVVELVTVIAAYNMVSRFLVALKVAPESS